MISNVHARRRILLSFLFGIAMPSSLLGYLAFRGIQNDRAVVEREQRAALEEAAAAIGRAARETLDSLEGALSRVAGRSQAPNADLVAAFEQFVREQPLVRAVFSIGPERRVDVVAAAGLRFRIAESGTALAGASGRWAGAYGTAAVLEMRSQDLAGALTRYQRLVGQAANQRDRGLALSAVARVYRKLGDLLGARDTYRQIRDTFGDVGPERGMPFAAAAGLEYAMVLVALGDTTGAVAALEKFHGSLTAGRWYLTESQFDLLTGRARDALQAYAGDASERLTQLVIVERSSRQRAVELREFEMEARAQLNWSAAGSRVAVVNYGGHAFYAIAAGRPPDGSHRSTWGGLLDGVAFAGHLARSALPESSTPSRIALLSQNGDTLAVSEGAAEETGPMIAAGLADIPSWTVEVARRVDGSGSGLLVSRRAVYLYAFVLLAGILLFGLVLTSRTVSRELELARMQSDFVSTVSHEFKSPLTAIRQLAEMLHDDMVPSEARRRQYYEVLLEQSERLSTIVENVLDFARMEEGRREMVRARVDVKMLIRDVVAEAQHRTAHEGFEIRAELDPAIPDAMLDAEAIRQALHNLIDNGVKYSGSARHVTVSGRQENGDVVIAVRDHGIGMAPAEASKVFERFYRGGGELTRTVKGTGLGLTLVRQIVSAHGGSVTVESTPGRGSTFAIRLPSGSSADDPNISATGTVS